MAWAARGKVCAWGAPRCAARAVHRSFTADRETLGALLGLPTAVVGITFSAVGTSLPNLVASMVVARKGLGNMAVSNALGSNTFNILIGLGLPWVLYCASHDGVYHGLPAEDIVVPVAILIVTLLAFLALLVCTGFELYRSHAFVFLFAYVAFLAWAVGKEYIQAPPAGTNTFVVDDPAAP